MRGKKDGRGSLKWWASALIVLAIVIWRAALLLTGSETSPQPSPIPSQSVSQTTVQPSAGSPSPEASPPLSPEPDVSPQGDFVVHFIDVGQADSILVQCGDSVMLVDGGNTGDSPLVCDYISGLGIDSIDCVVATHAHEDHIGGLDDVMACFDVKKVLSPVMEADSKCFGYFKDAVAGEGLELTVPAAGDSFTIGGAAVTVLGPVRTYSNANDTSIVLRVEFGDISVVLAGDAGEDAERDMLDSEDIAPCTVLKVGHHGSSTSTCYRWLYQLQPRYAVISVGAGNDYGHPHEETLSRLADADVTVYRTDLLGTIVMVSDGTAVKFYSINEDLS